MTRLRVAVVAVLCATVGGLVGATVAGAGSGTPEIDRANATIQVSGKLNPLRCVGEDGIPYITYTGSWKGGESQMLPDATDYPLSGQLAVSGIQWTINLKTQRGVLTAKVVLISPSGAPIYTGRLIVVTQGMLVAGANVSGRGWINGVFQLPDEKVSPGDDSLIANVEFRINLGGAVGQFGDVPGSLNTPNFSAVTNVAPVAQDGTC